MACVRRHAWRATTSRARTYLVLAGVVGAVLLVDDDGVPDVHHEQALEEHVRGAALGGGVLPRLDADAVVGAGEDDVADAHPRDVALAGVPAEAADAHAVARAAPHAGHVHAVVALADGDAVVARADARVRDGHPGAALDVDAVRVGAAGRRADPEPAHPDAPRLQQRHVEELGVHRRHTPHRRVPGVDEPHAL